MYLTILLLYAAVSFPHDHGTKPCPAKLAPSLEKNNWSFVPGLPIDEQWFLDVPF
jgi:hypothetical protein